MKKIILFFSLLALVGCGGQKTNKDKKVTLTFYHWEGDFGLNLLLSATKRFENENPNVTVELIKASFGDKYTKKIFTALAGSGDAVDIFETTSGLVPTLIQKGLLLKLDDYIIKYPELSEELYFKEAMHFFKYDENLNPGKGSVYGYAKDFSPSGVLYFNSGCFSRAGVQVPTISQESDTFMKMLQKLTIRDQNGFLSQAAIKNIPIENFIWTLSTGGKVYNEDSTRCILNSSKSMTGLTYVYDAKFLYGVTPNSHEMNDLSGMEESIGGGKLAIISSGRYMYPNIEMYSKEAWGILPKYYFQGQKPSHVFSSTAGWVINKNSSKKELAVKLLVFLMSERTISVAAQKGYNIPASIKVANSKYFLNIEGSTATINKKFLDLIPTSFQVPYSRYISSQRINEIFMEEHNEKYQQAKGPTELEIQDVLKQVELRVNEEIEESRK